MNNDEKIKFFTKANEKFLFEKIQQAGVNGISYDEIYSVYSAIRDGQNFLKKMDTHKVIVRGTHAVFYLPPEDRK